MINYILHFLTRKHIILYNKHRQTLPLANNSINKQNYWFFEDNLIWKYIPFKNSNKWKHRIMYVLLTIIQPKYIIGINWISRRDSLYKVWTANHPQSKFIVQQHGSYIGGIVTDIPHKYTNCDIFLTWGSFFVEQFIQYNSLKKVKIINFGNPVYNDFNRTKFRYKETHTNKVLILPTALDKANRVHFNTLIKKVKELNFQVFVKEHAKQGKEKDENGTIRYPSLEGVHKITGELYPILQNNDFDFMICDHSTTLLDVIFFKNKVIYFDPNNNLKGYTTNYSNYLLNLYLEDKSKMNKNTFYKLINLEKQEALFNNMVTLGNNQIVTI